MKSSNLRPNGTQATTQALKNAKYSRVIGALSANVGSAMASASSPEEAYKVFMASAGKGLMQVMANALAEVTESVSVGDAENPDIAGWQDYIQGCVMDMKFGSPSYCYVRPGGGTAIKPYPTTELTSMVVKDYF